MYMLQNDISSISQSLQTMPKRSRIVVLFTLPIAMILWFIGWGFYWLGSKKEMAKPKTITKANDLTFTVLLPEQKIEA